MKIKFIELTRGQFAIVDEDDFHLFKTGRWQTYGNPKYTYYASCFRKFGGPKRIPASMHRYILNILREKKDLVVDHINGDGLDNRKCNLRLASRSQNAANSRRIGVGVHITRRNKKRPFVAQISVKGKRVYLGYFSSKEEAMHAYRTARIKYFDSFDRGF